MRLTFRSEYNSNTPCIIQLFERRGYDSESTDDQAHYLQGGRHSNDRSHKPTGFLVPRATQKRAFDPRYSDARHNGRAKAESYPYASTTTDGEGNPNGLDGSLVT